jgi:hypothetical protein
MAFIRIGHCIFNTKYLKRDPLLPVQTIILGGEAAEDLRRHMDRIAVDWSPRVAGREPGSMPRGDRGPFGPLDLGNAEGGK